MQQHDQDQHCDRAFTDHVSSIRSTRPMSVSSVLFCISFAFSLVHLQPPFAAELVKTFVDFVQQIRWTEKLVALVLIARVRMRLVAMGPYTEVEPSS